MSPAPDLMRVSELAHHLMRVCEPDASPHADVNPAPDLMWVSELVHHLLMQGRCIL